MARARWRLGLVKLGTCPRCLRLAGAGGLLGWVAVLAAILSSSGALVVAAAAAVATAFTALFVAHVVAFAVRVRRTFRGAAQAVPAGAAETWSGTDLLVLTARLLIASFRGPGTRGG